MLFLTGREIVDVNDATKPDLEFLKKFFWGCLACDGREDILVLLA